jgi:hypothetical protein
LLIWLRKSAGRIIAAMSTTHHTPPIDATAYERWLDEIVHLEEGARLRGVSIDTLKRESARGRVKLLNVSARRLGIRRREALMK